MTETQGVDRDVDTVKERRVVRIIMDNEEHALLKRRYFRLTRLTQGLLLGRSRMTWADLDMIV